MPIKQYDTRDAVPEAQRAAAIETKEGKFVVSEEDPALGEKGERALAAAKEAQREEEKKRKAAEKEAADLKRERDARSNNITDEQLQKLRDEDAERRRLELDPITKERDDLKAKYRKATLTDRVQALALKHGVMPNRIKQAMKILDERVDLTDSDAIVVKSEEGKVTTETIDDFLAKTFKKESPWFYAGAGGSGSGAQGSDASSDDAPPPANDEAKEKKRREVAGAF